MNSYKQFQPQNTTNYGRPNPPQEYVDSQSDHSDFTPKNKIHHKCYAKDKKKDKSGKKCQSTNNSFWSIAENVLYKQFLLENGELFELDRQQRRKIKINVLISKKVKSRTPDQCRSHHQKMLKYHQSVPMIVDHIRQLENNGGEKHRRGKRIQGKGEKESWQRLLDWDEVQKGVEEGQERHLFYHFLREQSDFLQEYQLQL